MLKSLNANGGEWKMNTLKALMFGLTVALSTGVSAHTDEYLDTVSAPHGGQLRMAGGSHYELVVMPDKLQVYVTDHAGTAIPVKDAKGSAIVMAGSQKQNITFEPKNDNLLEGAGKFDPSQPLKAVVNIQMSGQEAQQARFDTAKLKQGGEHQHGAEGQHGDGHQGHMH